MKALLFTAALLVAGGGQSGPPPPKIPIALEAGSEGGAKGDGATAGLLATVRRGLEALGDVALVPRDQSRRTLWITAGARPGFYAASLMITERYDRETLMVLGIEDDDM